MTNTECQVILLLILQDRIPEIMPSQKCHVNMHVTVTELLTFKIQDDIIVQNIETIYASCSIKKLMMQFLFSFYFAFICRGFYVIPYMEIEGVLGLVTTLVNSADHCNGSVCDELTRPATVMMFHKKDVEYIILAKCT